MMPILNSSMDFAEVNVPPEIVEQNCLSDKTVFWGKGGAVHKSTLYSVDH